MKILLSDWASRQFSPAPHRHTLSKWRAEGRISPPPVFIGRAYGVDENARYVGEEREAPRRPDLRKKEAKASSGDRLVDRVIGRLVGGS